MNQTLDALKRNEDGFSKIFAHYGEKAQISKLYEEVNELKAAMEDFIHVLNEKNTIGFMSAFTNFADGSGDVLVMLAQHLAYLNKFDEEVAATIDYKVNRTLTNIK